MRQLRAFAYNVCMRIRVTLLLFTFFFLVPVAQAGRFIDTVSHPHEQYIEQIAELGIVQGYGHGIYRPDIAINRAEFLKILMLAVYGTESYNVYNDRCFADFTGESQWFWSHACTAKQRGIIGGYPDGTFHGAQTVNLAEALKMAERAWNVPTPPDVYAPEYWYVPYFEVAAERGLFEYFPQDGSYKLTRSDMAYLIVALGEELQDVSSMLPASSSSSQDASQAQQATPVCGNGILEFGEQCDDGNLENGDGCSKICVIVEETVQHGALRIEQRPVSVTTVSPGEKDVTLLAFDAIAGRQDVIMTNLVFRAKAGTLSAATNFRVYADSDGDGIADALAGTASPGSSTVSFSSIAIAVPEGAAVRVELVADFQAGISSGSFGVEFALDNARFVQGIGMADGRDLTGIELDGADCAETSICWIGVYTFPSAPLFQIVGRGNLYVTAASQPVGSRQLLAGKTTDDLLRITFRANGEDVRVKTVKLHAEETVFSQLLLYAAGGTFPIATAWTTNCSPVVSGQFCASTSFVVPRDQEVTYIVRGVVKSEEQGGTSGASAAVRMEADPAIQAVQAEGVNSQEDLTFNDGDTIEEGEVFLGRSVPGADQDIIGPTHTVVFAKILSIQNANSDPDQSSVPTGTRSFGKFRFTAAQNDNMPDGRNEVEFQRIVFTVNATNVQFLAGSFKLLNALDPTKTHECAASAYTGSISVTCDNLASSQIGTVIQSGGSIDLELRGFIVTPQMNPGTSILQASLQSLSDPTAIGTIEWSDGITTIGWVDIGQLSVNSTTYVK